MFDKQTNRHRGEFFFNIVIAIAIAGGAQQCHKAFASPFPDFNEPEVRELSNAHTQTLLHSFTMSMYHAWQDAHKQGANTVLKRCRGIKMTGQQDVEGPEKITCQCNRI